MSSIIGLIKELNCSAKIILCACQLFVLLLDLEELITKIGQTLSRIRSGSRYTRICKNQWRAHESTFFWWVNDETNCKLRCWWEMFSHEDLTWRNCFLHENFFLLFDPVKHSFTDKEQFQSYGSDTTTTWRNPKAFPWIKLNWKFIKWKNLILKKYLVEEFMKKKVFLTRNLFILIKVFGVWLKK